MRYNRKVFARYLNEREERQLFGAVKKYAADIYARRDYAWMRVLRQSGIRVCVLHGLNVSDARETLRTKRFVIRPEINKGAKSYAVEHDILANKKLLQAFKDLLKIRRELGYPEEPDAPLIISRKKQRMSIRAFQDRMQHWRQIAKLPVDASPHWFRHTLAKRIVARTTSNNPLAQVQGILGQKDINSAAIYTQADRDELDEVMEAAA